MKHISRKLPAWFWAMLAVSIGLAAFWTVWLVDALLDILFVAGGHIWHVLFLCCAYVSGYGVLMLLLLCVNACILWLHGRYTKRLDDLNVTDTSKPVGFLHIPRGYYLAGAVSILFLVAGIVEFSWLFRGFMAWLESASEIEMALFVPLGMILIGVGLVVFAGTFLIALLPVPCYFVFCRVWRFTRAYVLDMVFGRSGGILRVDGPLIGTGCGPLGRGPF